MKYSGEVRTHFRNSAAFTISDIRIFLKEKNIGRGYLYQLVHNLLKKGELKRITRGAYTFRSDAAVVGFGFRPFYYGLQDALSLRNLWTQETMPVIITPRKVRSGRRIFQGANYIIRRIGRRMFFGFETLRYGDFWIPVSDIEKTLIDLVYFREPLEPEALKEIRRQLKREKLEAYLKKCPMWARKKVLKVLKNRPK